MNLQFRTREAIQIGKNVGFLSSVESQMSFLLFAALAGHVIASKLRQPSSVGIILAGIIVGPSWLNRVTYTDIISTLAHLGAVIPTGGVDGDPADGALFCKDLGQPNRDQCYLSVSMCDPIEDADVKNQCLSGLKINKL